MCRTPGFVDAAMLDEEIFRSLQEHCDRARLAAVRQRISDNCDLFINDATYAALFQAPMKAPLLAVVDSLAQKDCTQCLTKGHGKNHCYLRNALYWATTGSVSEKAWRGYQGAIEAKKKIAANEAMAAIKNQIAMTAVTSKMAAKKGRFD